MTLDPVHFVLGSGRSGTTLLRVMLAGHRQLFSPPEMMLAFFENMEQRSNMVDAAFWLKGGLRRALMDLQGLSVDEAKAATAALQDRTIEQVFEHLQGLAGGRTIVDKCPAISYMPEALAALPTRFPGARYIWIVRHPGSVIRSFANMPMAEVMLRGLDGVTTSEDAWRVGNTNLRAFLETQPRDHWTMIQYEDLVTDPRGTMERVLGVLGVDWDEEVLDPYSGDRMREGPKGARAIGDPNMAGRKAIDPSLATKWLDGFDPRSVEPGTRKLAADLGYDLGAMELPPMAAVSDAIASLMRTVQRLEQEIDLPMDLDSVEGRRFLMRMLSESVDTFVEHIDADRPTFRHAEGPHRKMFADCPDTDYLQAPIDLRDGRTYRVTGLLPEGTTYVGLLLYGKGGRLGARMPDSALELDDQRRFSLTVSTDPTADLVGQGDEKQIMVRQYYGDRAVEAPIEVRVELLGEVPPPVPLDPAWLARRLALAQRMLEAIFKRTITGYKMVTSVALNRFVQLPAEALFPTPDNLYQVCWYRFGQDQVMFVRGTVPTARYFGFTLCNAWMESFDYTRHRVCINDQVMEIAADGTFEVCLAHRDPGHPNWISTAGHHAGYLIARNLLLEGDPSEFTIQVMYEGEWEAEKARRAADG